MATKAPKWRPRWAIWTAVAGTVVLVLSFAALGLRAWHVHNETWEWRLRPSAVPPKVHYRDRDYSHGAAVTTIDRGFVRRDETMGGGIIYAPSGPLTATVIDVVDGDRVVSYSLMGGP